MTNARPIIYDVSHLVSRMAAQAITGIDRVDLAFGRHFATSAAPEISAAFCRWSAPYIMGSTVLRKIVERSQRGIVDVSSLDSDDSFLRIKNWLEGQPRESRIAFKRFTFQLGIGHRLMARLLQTQCWLAMPQRPVPSNAIYLNIAEHWLEHHQYFQWLDTRPDIQAVFFVHDLLPFDYPEYFRLGYDTIFQRRFETMARRGTAFIVSTNIVRDRLVEALPVERRQVPIYVAPLPSPLAFNKDHYLDAPPRTCPYFLLVSTIEPRKNHLLVLNIWRELAARLQEDTPRLVLIGGHGWENEQVLDILERCEGIKKYVLCSTRISPQGLNWLMTHAQALLMPSFDEGYGLPIVEALSLGVPVLASDIRTFREVARGCAILLSPLDGIAWRQEIMALSHRQSKTWLSAKARVQLFQAPDWVSYFQGIGAFLRTLQ